MTAVVVILPDETERLCEEDIHALDRQVFHAMAVATDWSTGVVGATHRLSYSRLAAHLSEKIERKAVGCQQQVTARQVRNSVERLCRAGLYQRVSQKHDGGVKVCRVFWRDLLSPDNSVQKADGIQMASQLAAIAGKFSSNISELGDSNKSSRHQKSEADGIYSYIHTNKHAREDEFSLSLEWEPDEQAIDLLRKRVGQKYREPSELWTGEFVCYWLGDGRLLTANQWRQKWAAQMAKYIMRPGLFEKLNDWVETIASQPDPRMRTANLPALPQSDGKLEAYAVSHGLPRPTIGESYNQYRSRLDTCRIAKQDGKHNAPMLQ